MADIILATTEELLSIMAPYRGRLEYGNLRVKNPFPDETPNYADWMMAFEKGVSTNVFDIAYDKNSRLWGRSPVSTGEKRLLKTYNSREEAIRTFRAKILDIPQERRAVIPMQVAGLVKGLYPKKHKPENIFTSEELVLFESERRRQGI
jgi:hypothetical protein